MKNDQEIVKKPKNHDFIDFQYQLPLKTVECTIVETMGPSTQKKTSNDDLALTVVSKNQKTVI